MAPEFHLKRKLQPHGGHLISLVASILLSGINDASAECTSCSEWNYSSSPHGAPTTPTYVNGLVAHAVGGVVYLRRPNDGSAAGKYNAGAEIARPPAFTALPEPGQENWYVFASVSTGYLVKIAVPELPAMVTTTLLIAKTGAVAQTRDLRRAACGTDSLLAEPVVQRRADSNAEFTLEKDIVMVATAHACGDTTQNQVVALDAADVTQPPLWTFNVGEYEIGRINTCLLDRERNRLHCVAEHPASSFQPGVFSIDTNTGLLVWSAIFDTGAHARQALGAPGGPGAGHLYVGDEKGRVNSFDAADGTPHGSIPLVSVADGVTPDIDADLNAGSGLYAGMVFAVSSNGRIAALYDDGTDLIPAWESSFAGGQRVVTQAVPVESLHRIYAGTNDGNVHQFQLASGSDEASASIGIIQNTPATAETMTIAVYPGYDGYYRLVGSLDDPDIGTPTKQYRVPCAYASSACVPEDVFMDGFE